MLESDANEAEITDSVHGANANEAETTVSAPGSVGNLSADHSSNESLNRRYTFNMAAITKQNYHTYQLRLT